MAAILSIVAMLLLVLLLLDSVLLLGLLVDRGRVHLNLSAVEAPQFSNLTGLKLAEKAPAQADDLKDADSSDGVEVAFDEHGILPAVWRFRNHWFGGFVASLYQHISWLQTNLLAMIWLLVVGLILFVARSACLRQMRLYSHQIAIEGITAARRQVHRQVLRIGPEDLDGTGQEEATRLFVTEIESIRLGLQRSLSTIFRYPLELLGLLVVMMGLDWRLTLQWILPLSLGLLILHHIRQGTLLKQRLADDRCRDEQQALLLSFKNARLTRGLGIEQSEQDLFAKHLDFYHSRLKTASVSHEAMEHHGLLLISGMAIVLTFLVFLTCSNVLDRPMNSGNLTLADALTFFAALALSIPGIRSLKELPAVIHELSTDADKIQRFLNRVPAVSQAVGAKFLQPLSRTLHFENVKYVTPGGRKILDGVDFKLEAARCYGIVSLDPLEAKAVALMLPRFLEPKEGRVMIDGEDVAWVTLESLRAETVFVAADDPPIEGTVFDNIRGGQSDLTLQQVTEAAKTTRAHNFIVKLFNGYETVLASQGETLDVGQRFRLGLARAIVRNPALMLIEEPSGTLDEDTKTLLVDAYDRICRDRTVIFLPSRMSTVRRTDQIIVLHEGKVVAFGPQAKLVTQSPVYRHWEYLNFNEYRHDTDEGKN